MASNLVAPMNENGAVGDRLEIASIIFSAALADASCFNVSGILLCSVKKSLHLQYFHLNF